MIRFVNYVKEIVGKEWDGEYAVNAYGVVIDGVMVPWANVAAISEWKDERPASLGLPTQVGSKVPTPKPVKSLGKELGSTAPKKTKRRVGRPKKV